MIIDNQPVSTGGLDEAPVISPETRGVEHTIAMKWDSKRLASMIGPAVESIASPLPGHSGFGVKYGTDASLSNDYICNNVSYVVLHALKGISFSLAGEEIAISGPRTEAHDEPGSDIKIQISREVIKRVKVAGFIHYPDTKTDRGEVALGWASAISLLISGSY